LADNWIKGAISKPGSFKASAKAAGHSTRQHALLHQHDSGKLGARARLALTLMSMNKGKKKSGS